MPRAFRALVVAAIPVLAFSFQPSTFKLSLTGEASEMSVASTSSIPTFLLGGRTPVKRIVNGLWQTSSASGWGVSDMNKAVAAMKEMSGKGFSSFDGADHYGPAELLMGQLEKKAYPDLFCATKWCPSPAAYTKAQVEEAMRRSLKRMNTTKLDLMALHWWDYDAHSEMMATIKHCNALRKEGLIDHLGGTNFDTKTVKSFIDAGIPFASNQVQYSVIDDRPSQKMGPYCEKNGIALFTYGTLLGGLLSEKFLGKPEPTRADPLTVSQRKYMQTIQAWGGRDGWKMFQNMLLTLQTIGVKHGGYSISQVGIKYILDKPAVGAVIVGLRAGVSEHADELAKLFDLKLDDEDRAAIEAVRKTGRDLMAVIGDCGDEYRG